MPMRGLAFTIGALLAAAAASAASGAVASAGQGAGTRVPALKTVRTTGIWISRQDVLRLPMSGPAWGSVKATADRGLGDARLADQSSRHDTDTLAVALVYARTGNALYRAKAADAIIGAIGTEDGGRVLALARNLAAYVIAADLIELRTLDPVREAEFRSWLTAVRVEPLDGETLVQAHKRPNNWGTHAGASLAAADAYLGDAKGLAEVARVFQGWTGDTSVFKFARWPDSADTWAPSPEALVPVNPPGATVEGRLVDGALPAEQARCGRFKWPPCKTTYPWGGLSGALVQAVLLSRQGYPALKWGNQAVRRAMQFLYDLSIREHPFWWREVREGNDSWQPWLVNFYYGTKFPTVSPSKAGMPMGWTDWTHGRRLPPRR